MKKKILFIGGGTGGHMMPLIPLMKVVSPSWELHFLTGPSRVETQILGDSFSDISLTHHRLRTGKMRAYLSWRNITDLPIVLFSLWKSYRLLQKIDPDVVFFKGGHTGFPIAIALRLERLLKKRKRKVFLHESDITPGKLYAILKPICEEVFENFKDYPLFYYHSVKKRPSQKKPRLLIFAGSQGAEWINHHIGEIAEELAQKYDVTLIAGPGKTLTRALPSGFIQYESLPQKELFDAISKADLVISRAGASLFQILYLQKKALLIPLPRSARDHQYQNAQHFSNQGLCHLFEQDDKTTQDLLEAITAVEKDEKLEKSLQRYHLEPAETKIWKIISVSSE